MKDVRRAKKIARKKTDREGGWEQMRDRCSEGLWKCLGQLIPESQSGAALSLRFLLSVFPSNTGTHTHTHTDTSTHSHIHRQTPNIKTKLKLCESEQPPA